MATSVAPRPTHRPPSETVQRRAVAELRELAHGLHQRRRTPSEILLALHARARLLASAHGVRLFPCLPILRELPGLERYDPVADGERVESEWEFRAQALAGWLSEHAREPVAQRIVRLVLDDLKARHDGEQ